MSKYDEFDLDVKSIGMGNEYSVNSWSDGWKCKASEEIIKYITEKVTDAAIESVKQGCGSDNCHGPRTSMHSIVIREYE
ncbi:hypothetical protein [Tissierella pigra]|uniref:Uncharacterized protein n=1 Tax=Tissierella pigra TaxID=2607614 RepID=A0A6N7Y1C0_9FIRM|nr:hypothetical protein [Tissierella pigra]MSU02288.1 hypothetical protein [Tissierella pigra]